jgi:hypothetical protein|nr:MAG TPA: KilA-N domain [Caudoviricetes sp.]
MGNDVINVQGVEIKIIDINEQDYICITDMCKAKDGDFFISDWLRNRNTIEFLGIWESINNPAFNYGEFAIIKSQAGLNSYKISVKDWVQKTGAIGLAAKAGRYGGTYAHKDIAFEFGMWISPEFKLYLIKEFQRLKEQEHAKQNIEWSVRRTLVKAQYRAHTDAIKNNLIPNTITSKEAGYIYASEADMLNKALFGCTAKEWKVRNPNESGNLRDHASIEQLVVLAGLESQNALLIEQGIPQDQRLVILNKQAIQQLKSILNSPSIQKLHRPLVE